MRLDLISGFTRPKAKLDSVFTLKRELVRLTVTLCRLRTEKPTLLEPFRTSMSMQMYRAIIINNWKYMRESLIFDKSLHNLLDADVIDDNGEYKLVRISQQITNRLNAIRYKPLFPTPPIFAHDSGWLDSMYRKEFWMRIENDCFGHPTMLMKENEGDVEEKYFAIYKPYSPYPIYSQPFHAAKGVEKHFAPYRSVFDREFKITKGLLNLWFDVKF